MKKKSVTSWMMILFITVLFVLLVLPSAILAGECFVGAYYYPWYAPGAGGHDFASLRYSLVPQQLPFAGLYDCSDSGLIFEHIDQSNKANIKFWAVSWWGPGSFEDNIFRNYILTHPEADKLKYAIMYESTGRLGTFSSPDYSNLLPDFQFFSNYYFSNPNYLKIDGRPVVFIYLTRVYFRNQGDQALADLRAAYPDVYIVGDEIGGRYYSPTDAVKWDAVTGYDVYGWTMGIYGSTQAALDMWTDIMNDAKIAANSVGVGLIPSASPGFNDRVIRAGHSGAPRYFTDDPLSVEGDLFRNMLKDIVVPKMDPLANNMLMITSFNEWHEDTQIEATLGTGVETNQDNSASGTDYTEGDYYTDYGDLYLNILRQETQTSVDINLSGNVDGSDFAAFALHWLSSDCSYCYGLDYSGDENIDIDDLVIFVQNWLTDFTMEGYWKLDSNANDSSYYGNDGTIYGTPAWDPNGQADEALIFDGDDYVEMDVTNYKGILGTQSRTCAVWVQTDTLGTVVSWGDNLSNGNKWYLLINSSGQLRMSVEGGYKVGSTNLFGGWHHIATVLRGGSANVDKVEFYVDGYEEFSYSSVSSQSINTASGQNVMIGGNQYGGSLDNPFNGLIDDAKLYDRAFSSEEIAEIVGADGLIAHWEFDDDPCYLTASDSSGFGHDGTLTNMDPNDWVAGHVGTGAVEFDGVDDYIEAIGFKGPIDNRSRTASLWLQTTSTSSSILSWGNFLIDGSRWLFRLDSGALRVSVGGGRIVGSTGVDDGGWHHVAVVLEDNGSPDVSDIKLYVDGNLDTVSDVAAQAINTGFDSNVMIGRSSDGSGVPFAGQMDDVWIYSIALSEAEIQTLAGMGD